MSIEDLLKMDMGAAIDWLIANQSDYTLMPTSERDLIITALQALHRERVDAYGAACTACDLAGKVSPDRHLFGIDEVYAALQKNGASPFYGI